MSVKHDILTVGFDKNGEADFGVRCTVAQLTSTQMNELRAMISVAIGTMERMWLDERKPENRAVCAPATRDKKRELPPEKRTE